MITRPFWTLTTCAHSINSTTRVPTRTCFPVLASTVQNRQTNSFSTSTTLLNPRSTRAVPSRTQPWESLSNVHWTRPTLLWNLLSNLKSLSETWHKTSAHLVAHSAVPTTWTNLWLIRTKKTWFAPLTTFRMLKTLSSSRMQPGTVTAPSTTTAATTLTSWWPWHSLIRLRFRPSSTHLSQPPLALMSPFTVKTYRLSINAVPLLIALTKS